MVSLPNYVSYDLTAAIPVRGLEKGEEKKKEEKIGGSELPDQIISWFSSWVVRVVMERCGLYHPHRSREVNGCQIPQRENTRDGACRGSVGRKVYLRKE